MSFDGNLFCYFCLVLLRQCIPFNSFDGDWYTFYAEFLFCFVCAFFVIVVVCRLTRQTFRLKPKESTWLSAFDDTHERKNKNTHKPGQIKWKRERERKKRKQTKWSTTTMKPTTNVVCSQWWLRFDLFSVRLFFHSLAQCASPSLSRTHLKRSEVASAQVAIVHQFRLHIIYNYNESVTFCTDPRMEMHVDRHIVVFISHHWIFINSGFSIQCRIIFLKRYLFISLLFFIHFPFGAFCLSLRFGLCVFGFQRDEPNIATHYLIVVHL